MFSYTAQDLDWVLRFFGICVVVPLVFLRFLLQKGYWPRVLQEKSFASDVAEEIREESRRLFLRCLKGPVLFFLLLASVTFFWQAKYEQAAKDFQDIIQKERATHQKARAVWQDRRGDMSLHYRNRDTFAAEVTQSMLRSHREGYHLEKDLLILQQIEGYTPKGSIIWSNELHVFRASSARQLEKRIICLPENQVSKPATLQQIRESLAKAKNISKQTWGHSFKSFQLAERPESGRDFDVRVQMNLQVKGESGVYLHYFFENFPPSPQDSRPNSRQKI